MTPQEYGCTEIRTANLQQETMSPKEEFEACDSFLRSYEQQVTNWPAVAQACLRVKQGGLWKYGGHSSWHAWIHAAAPVSARTVFYHVGLFESLNGDYTPEELASIPPETAKQLQRLPRSVRSDPRVRKAANGKKRAFIATVQETHPEMHLENTEEIKLHLEASFVPLFHETVEATRVIEDDPTLTYEQCIELWRISWAMEKWREPELGISNISRARQLQELAK